MSERAVHFLQTTTLLLWAALATTACTVTGTAPSASAHTGFTCKCGTSGP